MDIREENGVLIDERGNRATIDWWGGREEAETALRSLENCSGCSDCSRCLACLDCSDCSGCSDCSDCSRCSYCADCADCADCSDCSDVDDGSPQKIPPIPVIERIHTKVYEAASKPDAFDMSNWHSCDTTHCRAGWVVHLAGKEGYDLEARTSPLFAAQQIYRASGYDISPVRFYDSHEQALADMKRLSEEEAKLSATN